MLRPTGMTFLVDSRLILQAPSRQMLLWDKKILKKGLTSFFNNAIDVNKLEKSNEKNLIFLCLFCTRPRGKGGGKEGGASRLLVLFPVKLIMKDILLENLP